MDCELWGSDGTCFDVPDSDENARDMERPGSRPGTQAAFPARQISHIGRSGNAHADLMQ